MMDMPGILTYLSELRARLLKCLVVLLVLMLFLLPFSQYLFSILAMPLLKQMPQGHTLIATGIVSPVFVPLKLAMIAAVFLAMPYFIFQAWMFVSTGLYENERRVLWLFMVLSSILFYMGALFVYFVFFPVVFRFFMVMVPEGVTAMPDISQYLDFCLKLILAFGLAFEIPVIVALLAYQGVCSIKSLIEARPYVIVGAFILAMFMTPPDVVSQIMLAVPMCLFYESGIVFAGILLKRKARPLTSS
ncbi:twin-arginine translocase subunit TatC [Legionella sp. CNM-4043-24]|uniref:twin-arginine translocase subunit TatC n=1 Tax=Legionella sp. CNM-4043-24 TaxID=3421646 RepID=UPI00403A8262